MQTLTPPVELANLTSITSYKALVVQMGEHGPQFVSPIVIKNNTCQLCKEQYGPIIYQVGRIAMTQHKLTCHNANLYSEANNPSLVNGSHYITAKCTAFVRKEELGYAIGPYLRPDYMAYMRCYACANHVKDASLYYFTATEQEQHGARFLPMCYACSSTYQQDLISQTWSIHHNTDLEIPVITFRKLALNTDETEHED